MKLVPSTFGSEDPNNKPFTRRSSIANPAEVGLQIAVVADRYPEELLTEQQCKDTQMSILAEVCTCEPSKGPQFTNSYSENGVVYVTCANKHSRNWLEDRIASIKPWEGASLRIGTSSDFVQKTKVELWIPTTETIEAKTTEELMEMLKIQNSGLDTGRWKVISRQEDERGITLMVDIDERSMRALEKVGFKAFLGFHQLTFRALE